MSEKMKGRCLILVALLMVMPYAPAVLAAEIEVDKGEFNAKWQETYNELKAIDPAAAEEFRTLTVEEFKTGRVGYAPDAEGQTAQTTPTASVRAQGIRGPRETANAPAPTAGTGLNSMPRGQYGGPVPGNAPGAGPGPYPGGPVAGEFRGPLIGGQMYGPPTPGGYGQGPMADSPYLKEKGLSDEAIAKVHDAQRVLSGEAAKVEWEKMSPQEREGLAQSYEQRFKEMTGLDPVDIFGGGPMMPPMPGQFGPGSGPQGPMVEGPFTGPYYGPGAMGPGSYGPAPEGVFTGLGSGQYGPGPGAYYGPAPLGNEHVGPGPFGPMPEGQMFQGPVGPQGPYFEGPFVGPVPGVQGPMFEGPFVGPGPQGPMFEGPYVGPAPEGPMFEGPIGPPPDGPYFEGPMGPPPEGPMFEPPPVVEPPPFEPPPGPEPPPPPPPG